MTSTVLLGIEGLLINAVSHLFFNFFYREFWRIGCVIVSVIAELTNYPLFFRNRLTLTVLIYLKIDNLQCPPDRISVYGGYTRSLPIFYLQSFIYQNIYILF